VGKRTFSISLLIFIIYMFLFNFPAVNNAWAWTEPRQLTNHLYMHDAQAASWGRNIYLLGWRGGYDFYFLHSWNNGFSWGEPTMPADTFYGGSLIPDIECTPEGLIHVVWLGLYEGETRWQVFHQTSSDRGSHWSNRHRIFNNTDLDIYYPRLTSNGDSLFLTCLDGLRLVVFRSFDSGLTWGDSSVVDTATGMSYPPTILYSSGRLHMVYQILPDDSTGVEIFYSSSDDLGLTWSTRVALSTTEHWPSIEHSQFPSAYADSQGNIIAAWYDYKYGSGCGGWTGDILTRVSTDNGNSWLPEGRITDTHTGEASSCLILNGTFYVAWMDNNPLGCDYPKIMLSSSSDRGQSWSEPEVITGNGLAVERSPFLLSGREGTDTLVHCFYDVYDPSYGTDLYYVRNKSFYSDRKPIPRNQPVFLNIRAYPNVFNSTTLISFENSEGGDVQLEIFDVNGKKVWSRCVSGKEGSTVWDAVDNGGAKICSGIYFVRATSKEDFSVIKLLYLK